MHWIAQHLLHCFWFLFWGHGRNRTQHYRPSLTGPLILRSHAPGRTTPGNSSLLSGSTQKEFVWDCLFDVLVSFTSGVSNHTVVIEKTGLDSSVRVLKSACTTRLCRPQTNYNVRTARNIFSARTKSWCRNTWNSYFKTNTTNKTRSLGCVVPTCNVILKGTESQIKECSCWMRRMLVYASVCTDETNGDWNIIVCTQTWRSKACFLNHHITIIPLRGSTAIILVHKCVRVSRCNKRKLRGTKCFVTVRCKSFCHSLALLQVFGTTKSPRALQMYQDFQAHKWPRFACLSAKRTIRSPRARAQTTKNWSF